MHPTHDLFHLSDGDLSCRRCHICNCHSPELAAEPCEFEKPEKGADQ